MKAIQFGWQACSKCGGLFYTDRTPVPTCQAGGQHATSGNTNRGVMNVPATWTDNFPDSEEPNWRFCANCHGLFRILGDADAVDHGVCIHAKMGSIAHVIAPGSSLYVLESIGGSPGAADRASAYYECSNCGSLFHDWPNGTLCNAGGQHVKAPDQRGGKYFLLKAKS
jgi:hypothetical protein